MDEQWTDVTGWKGYYKVSSRGRVKSLARIVKHRFSGTISVAEKILAPVLDTKGYLKVTLSRCNRQKTVHIHSLVLTAFGPPKPISKVQVNHKDCNKRNNWIQNLEWVSHLENVRHAVANDLVARGERNGSSVLTDLSVSEIRGMAGKITITELARKYDVSRRTIEKILTRERWTHVA